MGSPLRGDHHTGPGIRHRRGGDDDFKTPHRRLPCSVFRQAGLNQITSRLRFSLPRPFPCPLYPPCAFQWNFTHDSGINRSFATTLPAFLPSAFSCRETRFAGFDFTDMVEFTPAIYYLETIHLAIGVRAISPLFSFPHG